MKLKEYSIYYFDKKSELLEFCKFLNISTEKIINYNPRNGYISLIYPCLLKGYEGGYDYGVYSKEEILKNEYDVYFKDIYFKFFDGIKELRKIKLENIK